MSFKGSRARDPGARRYVAVPLWFARARRGGDGLDVFVDVVPGQALNLDDFMGIYEILTRHLGTKVDYTTRAGLIEFYRPAIEREALKVF